MPSITTSSMEVHIHGIDQIEKRLQQLPEKLRRRAIRSALQAGTELIRAEAARLAPRRMKKGWEGFVHTGEHLKDAVVAKFSITERNPTAKVGLDYKIVKHGHVMEFGAKPHMIGKIKHPGAKKHPFMRPAIDSKGDEAIDTMVEVLVAAVEKEV